MYKINLNLVVSVIRNLPPFIRRQILSALDELQLNPYTAYNARPMQGAYKRYYRCKVGDYRIIYEIQEFRLQILVMKIGQRKNIYRDSQQP